MSTTSSARSPLWFCYECHAEMRPLMVPDPHCASCNGTFLEEMDGTGEDDPRQLAAENEQTQAVLNLLNHGFPGGTGGLQFPLGGGGGSRLYTTGSSGQRLSRSAMPSIGSGGTIRIDMRSGPNGRNWTFQREGGGSGGGQPSVFPPGFPSLPDFVQNRRGSAPTSPVDDEIETPYGPRSRRYRGPPPPLSDDPRAVLMHYFAAMLAGNPGLMFEEIGGPIQGSGAFGDYVFNQEGLDRIITQLMETAGQSKPNPAPEDLIAGLKRTKLTYDCDLVKAGQSCAICTEYFAPLEPESTTQQQSAPRPDENTSPGSGVAITLPCAHSFHDDCIITWLKTSGTCPVCRYALVEQPGATGPGGAPAPPPGAASTSTSNPIRTNNPPPIRTNNPPPISTNNPPPIRTNNPPPIRTNNPPPVFSPPRTNTPPPGSNPTRAGNPPPVPSTSDRVESRPQADRTLSSRSGESNSANRPSSPQGQADTFFSHVGGPGALLETIFGLIGGHGARPREPEPENATTSAQPEQSTTPPPRSPTPAAQAPGRSSERGAQNERRGAPSPRSPSPPIFFRDRGQGGNPSNRSNQGSRGASGWDDVD